MKKNIKTNRGKHHIEVYWKKKQLFLLEPKTFFVLVIASFLFLLVYFFGSDAGRFLTSVLSPVPEHAPYDGLTYPIQKVPDWIHLTEAERKATYSALPESKFLPIPAYIPERLSIPIETLKWGNDEHNQIRNEKITYAVPYLGNYQLNNLENVGSHPAVDIKIPEGTPIYAIGNGTVVKTQDVSSGFGKNVVIQHNDFPSFDNSNGLSRLFSGYAHLSEILVQENQVIRKGQLIAYSGNTGASTAPHLHFQIDTDESLWHPYWPFNNADMKSAGLSFFEAINAGLNKDKAISNTINPMKYVQRYIGERALIASPETPVVVPPPLIPTIPAPVTTETALNDNEPKPLELITYSPAHKNSLPFPRFEVRVPSFMYVGEATQIKIQYFDADTNNVPPPNGESQRYYFQVLVGDGSFDPVILRSEDFVNGTATVTVTPKVFPEFAFTVSGGGSMGSTDIVAVHERGAVVVSPSNQVFSDIPEGYEDEIALRFLKDTGVIKGYPDGTFRPQKTVYRVEALKMIFEALQTQVDTGAKARIFPDLTPDAWYLPYVLKAFNDNVVAGYPDGNFRPTAEVNIVEFYKMLFLAAKTDIDPQVIISLPTGVFPDDWFAPYVQEAVKKNILEIRNDPFNPGYAMTRGDIAIALYKLLNQPR